MSFSFYWAFSICLLQATDTDYYVGVYGALSAGATIFSFLATLSLALASISTAKKIFLKMLHIIAHMPMRSVIQWHSQEYFSVWVEIKPRASVRTVCFWPPCRCPHTCIEYSSGTIKYCSAKPCLQDRKLLLYKSWSTQRWSDGSLCIFQ